jgi:uncharacterized protein YbjT (DUF2867 family)
MEQGGPTVKIVVIGGTGLIGSQVVRLLSEQGHEAVAASPRSGVNSLTGEGLAEVLAGADAVIDVSNSPSFEAGAVLDFFRTSTANLLAAEATAGVKHHVVLSIVGLEGLPDNGYFRAKLAQEELVRESQIPYTFVRATQFFGFVQGIAQTSTVGNTVHIAPVRFQPLAAADVASTVARFAVGAPINGIVEVAGPESFRFDELVARSLRANADPREVIADPAARYFGSILSERSLVPEGDAILAETRFEDWLQQSTTRQ